MKVPSNYSEICFRYENYSGGTTCVEFTDDHYCVYLPTSKEKVQIKEQVYQFDINLVGTIDEIIDKLLEYKRKYYKFRPVYVENKDWDDLLYLYGKRLETEEEWIQRLAILENWRQEKNDKAKLKRKEKEEKDLYKKLKKKYEGKL